MKQKNGTGEKKAGPDTVTGAAGFTLAVRMALIPPPSITAPLDTSNLVSERMDNQPCPAKASQG